MDYKLILGWLALILFTVLAWAALIEYVFAPALHVMGGVFRMAVFR